MLQLMLQLTRSTCVLRRALCLPAQHHVEHYAFGVVHGITGNGAPRLHVFTPFACQYLINERSRSTFVCRCMHIHR